MAEILPTPVGVGTILIIDPQGPPWTPQPRAGTILIIDPQGPDPVRRGARGFGMVRGHRG